MEDSEFNYEDLASEEAISLVYFDDNSKEFVVNPEAISFLKSIEAPLGVIAVAGMYRTGKSYLLNRVLLNRNNGFGVGNTVNACTKGIWIWKKVVKGKSPDKEDINVLVLDSEGLGALDEDSNHDVRIFSLAILLSSYFIYNSMGSIDENALQSLSLVVQLTKHIQIKSTGMSQDVDPEEYSKYFPSFMWVVRDFSLQLVDNEGESITSKDYLEKALHEQKGFSESAEQKNRIRRLLRCFFKERDCSCVVRPSTKEEDLQNLESCDFETLRDEFKSQITALHTKVMKRVKPKTIMSGQRLSGPMYADLVINYVTAINKGAVPNIENAWTYISKGECQKAMEKSYETFCEDLTTDFENHAPVFEYDLKNMYKEAKSSAISLFEKSSVGDVAEQFKDDLKTRMKQKYSQIKAENEKVTKNEAGVFLAQFFSPIEEKLRNQEYTTFHQYETEVKEVESTFMERGPPGPNREAICQSYVINALTDGAAYFHRTLENELNLQKSLGKESQEKLESRIQELKGDLNSCKDDYENKMRTSENQKAQLIAKEQSMRETLNEVKKDKENSEKEWKTRLQSEKTESNRLVEEYKNRMVSSEENAKESQRRMMANESESDKQKALLEQKVDFLEKNIETCKNKEKEYQTEIKNQKKELTSSIKENNQKFEEKITELNKKLDDAQDEITDKDNKISELEQKVYVSNTTISEKDIELKNLRNISAEIEKLKDDNERLKEELEENQKTYNAELQEDRDNLKFQLEQLKLEFGQKENDFNAEMSKMEKEHTIQLQKIDFLNTQVDDANNKIEENRKTHESMLKAVQNRETEKEGAIEEADKKIEELKQVHYQEMKDLEERFEGNNKKLSDELDKLRQSEGDAKMELKLFTTDRLKEIAHLKDSLEKAENERSNLQVEAKDLEAQKQTLVQQTEERYRNQIDQLERDLEEKNQKSQGDLEVQQQKFENDLANLKSLYEVEKEGLKKKVQDEKAKGAKNVRNTIEDYEQRMQDEQNQHEEDLEMLQDELRDKEDQLQGMTNRFEHEMSLNEQKIQSLEEHLKETKDALDSVQEKNSLTLDNQLVNFNKERKELLDKADEVQQVLTEKEKKITGLENKNESLQSEIKKRDEEIETIREESGDQKKALEAQIEDLREKNQTLADESMQKKLESGREEALTKQKIEFQDKKIEELLKALSDSSTKYQEKLDSQKTEQEQEITDKIDKIIAEKEKIVNKFDEKKKAFKELEKETSVKITKLEREKAVNLERIENLEKKLENTINSNKAQVEQLRAKISSMQDKGSKTAQESEVKSKELLEQIAQLEKERGDLRSKYDKEEALWQGKHQFLSEQKDQLKSDLQETKKKMEEAIAQLQDKGPNRDQEKKQLEIINHMEKDHKSQISTLQEAHEKYVTELTEKNKELESKNLQLQEKYELSFRDSSSSTRTLEKRLGDFEAKDKSQTEEISALKQQRDKMMLENQQAIEKERETLKSKINDIEKKFHLSEQERSNLKFEIEKQQAKWNTEKDGLETMKQEMQDTISRLEKKNENLVIQNEKLKEKTKNSRKYGKYGGMNTSSYLDTSQNSRFMTGKYMSINKEVDPDSYSNNSGKENRFKPSYTKFIGDGREGDKKSTSSGYDDYKTPDAGKGSESTNTLSPTEDKE